MKKKVFGKKLSRSRPTREALFASLMRSMILNGKIETTKAKVKAIQPELEGLVTLAKKGGVNAARTVLAKLDNKRDAVNFLFQNVVKSFEKRKSGFSRATPLPSRRGDNAPMVRLEWVDEVLVEDKKGKKGKRKKEDKSKKVKTAKKVKAVKTIKSSQTRERKSTK